MEGVRYISKLGIEDILEFLITYGQFEECTIKKFRYDLNSGITVFFAHNNKEYRMACRDFELIITRICYGIEENTPIIKPCDEDWLCFLKKKFGDSFVKYYAKLMNASQLIYSDSMFLHELSYNDISFAILLVLKGNENRFPTIDYKGLIITEVESFFKTERRFWILDKSTNLRFYIRLSDSTIISPSLNSTPFRKYMVKKFGDKYIKAFPSKLFTF